MIKILCKERVEGYASEDKREIRLHKNIALLGVKGLVFPSSTEMEKLILR
jgi:hypothetical protein